MKKITTEEYNELIIISGRGEQHPVISELLKLNVGEILQIEKKDWVKKTPLCVYVGNYKVRMGMSFTIRSIKEQGWLIKRLT